MSIAAQCEACGCYAIARDLSSIVTVEEYTTLALDGAHDGRQVARSIYLCEDCMRWVRRCSSCAAYGTGGAMASCRMPGQQGECRAESWCIGWIQRDVYDHCALLHTLRLRAAHPGELGDGKTENHRVWGKRRGEQ